jgi:hypothetical protein
MAQQRRSSLAVVWGLLCGGIYLLVALADRFAGGTPLARRFGALTLDQALLLLVEVALFFVAGLLAARRTGREESGALAGVVTGLAIGIAMFMLILISGVSLQQRIHAQGLRVPGLRAEYVAALIRAGLGIAVAAVVGLAVGALGGLAGRGQQQQPPALMDRTHGTPPPGPTPAGFGAHAPYAGYAGGDAPTIHTPQSPEG